MAEQKKKKKKQVVELTPAEKFVQLQTLKRATGCMLVEQDIYDIYVKLTKDFADLSKVGEKEPFEGCEQCLSLSEECAKLAEEWKKKLPAERVVESRTVTTTAREREGAGDTKKGKGKWIALGVLVLIVAFIVCYNIEATRYYIACAEATIGLDDLALQSYEKLGQYKDSEARELVLEKKNIVNTKKGAAVSFGNCQWRVVSKQEDKVLLARNEVLTNVAFHERKEDVTWEKCTLRQYLNGTFLDKTFSEEEKKAIIMTPLVNEDNVQYGTKGGKETADKVFILSESEVKKYKKALKDQAKSTRLRTPGYDGTTTMFLSYRKKAVRFGVPVDELAATICPMIWVDVK